MFLKFRVFFFFQNKREDKKKGVQGQEGKSQILVNVGTGAHNMNLHCLAHLI